MASITLDSAVARPRPLRQPLYRQLYIQVLLAIVLGGLFGWAFPDAKNALNIPLLNWDLYASADWTKALGDGFVNLIKMVIAPVIFCTVVSGISHVEDATKVGRVGVKALVYFEIVSTFALVIGLFVGNVIQPGLNATGKADAAAVAGFVKQAGEMKASDFILHIIPDSVIGAFARGDILQVLLFAVLFGFAVLYLGERGKPLRDGIDMLTHAIFGVIAIVMKAAPIGAFGAMAYTIGKYGTGAVLGLIKLIGVFYLTSLLFVLVVLGGIAAATGFNILRLIAYLKAELLLVLGTSSSESALPLLMAKLERLGCPKSVVGLVVPTGYSFNLDGTNIYMTLATLFIAQALGVSLTFTEQLTILGVAMLTSKGASGVAGSGFITLAATLGVVNPALVPGMAIVLGVDKFMSECRALTNFIGNSVASIVVSAWEGELDRDKLRLALSGQAEDLSGSDVRAMEAV